MALKRAAQFGRRLGGRGGGGGGGGGGCVERLFVWRFWSFWVVLGVGGKIF